MMNRNMLVVAMAMAAALASLPPLVLANDLYTPVADASAKPDAAKNPEGVSVIGQGETRQVQRVTPADTLALPPGTSIQKVLNRMPGVNVQSNDAFGAPRQAVVTLDVKF